MVKRIVICCDGTWNTPRQPNPTNVIKFARAVLPSGSGGIAQVVFYDPGVGTESAWWDKIRGGVLGKGLDKNIEDAYRFLALNHEPGDYIYLVGFSRGAYTARSLAGMLHNCGLLRKIHLDKYPCAFKLYQSRGGHPKSPEAREFRRKFSQEVLIKFIGVWDTVGAMGIPVGGIRFAKKRYQFHDVKLSRDVQNAFHAVSIDEKRKTFKPALWKPNVSEGTPSSGSDHTEGNPFDGGDAPASKPVTERVEQVWFAGYHSDVGGGSDDHGLSDHAFTWLVEKAEECHLAFDREYLDQRIEPEPKGPAHDSMQWWYKPLGKLIRTMGLKLNEAVHPGVLTKYEAQGSSYRPQNLVDYLADPGHKVAQVDSPAVDLSDG